MLKVKLTAAMVHGLATILIAGLTASVVFFIWYPGAFAQMLGGAKLYLMIIAVEICLGPAMSLVIYNPNKPRSELIRDYCIVGTVQLAALFYGLYTVALARPVYTIFVKDRFEVVTAVELIPDDIKEAKPTFQNLSWFGPREICVESPSDSSEQYNLIISGLQGKDIHLFPKYYVHCEGEVFREKLKSKKELIDIIRSQGKLEILSLDILESSFGWIPIRSRFGFWVIIYSESDKSIPLLVNVDPYA